MTVDLANYYMILNSGWKEFKDLLDVCGLMITILLPVTVGLRNQLFDLGNVIIGGSTC